VRVLIVDDEPLARMALGNILAARNDVEHFDSAYDSIEAIEKLAKGAYDVLLLDVNMPELSGTELVDQLRERGQPMPSVVFVTAHDEHAIMAFERNAVDYVLKPFSDERIEEALNRALQRARGQRAVKLIEGPPRLQEISRPQHPRIALKTRGRILFVDPSELVAVQAEGNYVLLQRSSGSYLLRESISAVEEKFKRYGFIRIHRSVLVNASFVEEIKPYLTGEYSLRVKGGKEYTVTRTYKKNLRSLAEFWIGGNALLTE
jgi:DNA-binding LytR/AlgR family response regulator